MLTGSFYNMQSFPMQMLPKWLHAYMCMPVYCTFLQTFRPESLYQAYSRKNEHKVNMFLVP